MAWLTKSLIFTALCLNLVLGTIPGKFDIFRAYPLENSRHPRNIAKKEDSIARTSLFRPNAIADFTRTVQVSPAIEATWTVYYDIGKIDFYVEAKTKGFVGFGITDDGRLADLVIGGVNDDESPYFADRNSATGNGTKVDARQDWQLHEVIETSDSTLLWFIRSLDTGDAKEDIAITDRETNIVWLTGETDDIEGPSSSGLFPVNMLDPGLPKVDFERTETLNTRLLLTWKVNFTTKKVTFDLTANTTGYIGFGIGKTTSMSTDMITGGVNGANLTPYFTDRKGGLGSCCGDRVATADANQNYLLISAREVNGVTRLRFMRDFDTGDANDYVIKYENAYFIWALGDTDTINKHTTANRGSFAVNPLVASG